MYRNNGSNAGLPLLVFLLLTFVLSCKKEQQSAPHAGTPPLPINMEYVSFNNMEVIDMNRKRIDVDKDGRNDFFFEVLPVADPLIGRDRLQFYIYSLQHTSLLNDQNDESPMLGKGDSVLAAHVGYTWWAISAIVLTEKITPNVGDPFWQGSWKNAANHYLPFRLTKNNQFFYGWIEMSVNKADHKLIVQKAAICKDPGKGVKAGL
jgi:hypothetical protein